MKWWVARDGRRLEVSVQRLGDRFAVRLDGTTLTLDLVAIGDGLAALLAEDGRTFAVAHRQEGRDRWRISLGDRDYHIHLRDPLEREIAGRQAQAGGPQEVRAPIPGKVVAVTVAGGQEVAAGQTLVVLEAMKMENQICAERAGTVQEVRAAPGATVEGGEVLLVLA